MTRRDTQMAHLSDTPLLGAAVGLGEGERASLCAEVPKPDGGGTPFPRLLFLVLLVLVAVWSSATRGGGDAVRRGLRRAERVASRSLSKISVKYAKISQNIRQISLNLSQIFVPSTRRPPAARPRCRAATNPPGPCNSDTFRVSETDSEQIEKVSLFYGTM